MCSVDVRTWDHSSYPWGDYKRMVRFDLQRVKLVVESEQRLSELECDL